MRELTPRQKQILEMIQEFISDTGMPPTRAEIEAESEVSLRRSAMEAAKKRLELDLEERRAAAMPPFGRLAGVILSGSDLQQVFDLGNALARQDAALRKIGAQVYGPAPAPIARIRGRHRVRLLVKADKGAPLQAALKGWLKGLNEKGKR